MVTTFYPPYHFGGDGVFVYRLAEALAEAGHSVDVVHSIDAYRLHHPEEPESAFPSHPNVTRHGLDSGGFWSPLAAHQLGRPGAYAERLRAVLEGGNPDVIHFHNVSLMGAPGVLRLGRAPKLYTTHEYWLVCPTHVLFAFDREACTERRCLACTLAYRRPPQAWRYTRWLDRCLAEVDRVLVPSAFALEQHRSAGIDRPLRLLPHFVPGPDPAPAPPDAGRPYFLYAGRLEKLKGVHDLIDVFAGYDKADLAIAGAGSQAGALRERAKGLPHVRFLGQVHPEDLGALYRQALAVVVPSLCYETFGLTAAEALMHGTPVVVRRIGALTEIVEATGGGFLFSSPDECHAALERLQTEPGLRAEMGERGRRAAPQLWSREAHLDQYLRIVDEVLGARTG